MLINTESLYFSEKHGVLGSIVGVDVVGGCYELVDKNEDFYEVDFEDAVEVRSVGTYQGVGLFENDILESEISGVKYILRLSQINNKYVDIFVLDGSREIYTGDSYPTSELEKELGDSFRFIGNAFELEDEESKFDFNIKVVREHSENDVIFHYACNDKVNEKIDLIKVIYVGHHLLEEEAYERESISYDDYSKLLDSGTLVEVSPYELQNYVMGLDYVQEVSQDLYEEEDVEDIYYEEASEMDEFEAEIVVKSDEQQPKNPYGIKEIYCLDCEETIQRCDCDDIWGFDN